MNCVYDRVNALVLGAGLSGEAAALLLLSRGGRVLLADEGDESTRSEVAERVRLAGGAVRFGTGEVPSEPFDVCVVSPAFAMSHPWVERSGRAHV